MFVKKVNFNILLPCWLQLEWPFLHISNNWAWVQWCLCAAAPNYQLTVSAWAKSKLFDNPCMWHVSYCLKPAAQLGRVGCGGDLHQGFGLAARMRCVAQAMSLSAVLQVPKAIMPDRANIWAKFSQKGSGRAELWPQPCQMQADDLIQVSSNLCPQYILQTLYRYFFLTSTYFNLS